MPSFADVYSFIGGMALLIALVSGVKYGGKAENVITKKIFNVSGALFVVMLVADIAFDIAPRAKENEPPPKIEEPAPPKVEQPAPVEEKKFYSNGQFKVGVDLPAGEYLAVGTGYVEVASAPELTAIIYNDNFENAQRYVDVRDGEYVKVEHALKLYALADAPKISVQGKIPDGQFKVGSDISAGEYKITLSAGGYFAVTKSPRNDFVTNHFTNEGGTYYTTVADGQYLQIKKGSAEAVTTAAPQAKQPAAEAKPAPPPAPAKILNLGMTLPQFQDAFAAKATQFGLDGVNLDDVYIQEGQGQDVFRADDISGRFALQGTLDKQSGLVKEVWILIQPRTSDDMVAGVIVYGLFSHVFNPELDKLARGKLMDDLHLSKDVEYLQKHTATAIRGNAKYSARLLQGGIYMLAVSAKDL